MPSKYILIFSVILFALPPSAAPADDNEALPAMVTDRPDFTESTETVSPWVLQLEGGLALSQDHLAGGSSRTLSGPNSLLRLGVARRVEMRFGAEGFLRESVYGPERAHRRSGFSDVGIGAKIKLAAERGLRPAVSVIPSLSLPTGRRQFTSSGYDPSIGVAWSKGLPRGFEAGGNVNFASVSEEGERFFQRAWSLTFGHELFADLRGYWEVYRIGPPVKDEKDLWVFNTGLVRGLGDKAQIDLAVGRSLHPLAPSWFVSIGFAIRAPFHPRPKQ